MSTCVLKAGERVLKMKGSDGKCGRPQIIIVPPGFLKASSHPPVKIAKISPKEPLIVTKCVNTLDSMNPVRKRANLDHLSTEEKLLRRKLKNRVAAQNARDKKRVKMDEMEDEIQRLRDRNSMLEEENRRLRECRSRLEPENASFSFPLSPATSSSSEEEELSTIIVESNPESMPSPPAERVNDLQQKGRATILGSLLLLWSLLHSLAKWKNTMRTNRALKRLQSSYPLSPRLHFSHQKEKRKSPWWGPSQKAWNPRIWTPSLQVK